MNGLDTVHYPRQGIIHEILEKLGILRHDLRIVQELIKVMNDRTHTPFGFLKL